MNVKTTMSDRREVQQQDENTVDILRASHAVNYGRAANHQCANHRSVFTQNVMMPRIEIDKFRGIGITDKHVLYARNIVHVTFVAEISM